MNKPLITKHRAKALTAALFLLSLAALFFLDTWWPALVLIVGISLAFRQFLLGYFQDSIITLFVFIALFFIIQCGIASRFLIPTLLVITAFYVLRKAWSKKEITDEGRSSTTIEIERDV